MKCHGCGVEKDPNAKEVYPAIYQETDGIIGDPIDPFFLLEVSPRISHEDGDSPSGQWRTCKVCHECFHRLQPDMWISRTCWESINPTTPFKALPKSSYESL